eukprot:15481898-Alexandrium_andersonii.AAC.1
MPTTLLSWPVPRPSRRTPSLPSSKLQPLSDSPSIALRPNFFLWAPTSLLPSQTERRWKGRLLRRAL